jgi:hypothetical protein
MLPTLVKITGMFYQWLALYILNYTAVRESRAYSLFKDIFEVFFVPKYLLYDEIIY